MSSIRRQPRRVGLAVAIVSALAALALGSQLAQALAVNAAMRSLGALTLAAEQERAPSARSRALTDFRLATQVFGALPASDQTADELLWIGAQLARRAERLGLTTDETLCSWDVELCQASEGQVRLTDKGHERLTRAYAAGRLTIFSPLEQELVAMSCLTTLERTPADPSAEECLRRLAAAWPELGPLARGEGVYVARLVPELTALSAEYAARLVQSGGLTCNDARAFVGAWVTEDGFAALTLAPVKAVAEQCPDDAEVQFYLARAADLAGQVAEARAAYERARPEEHPEAAFWQIDLLSRTGACTSAAQLAREYLLRWPGAGAGLHLSEAFKTCCRSDAGCTQEVLAVTPCASEPLVFEAEALGSRFAESDEQLIDNILPDQTASGGLARRSLRHSTFVAYGPYVELPYGRYRLTAYVRAEGASPIGSVFRFDVRTDYGAWRSYVWSDETVAHQNSADAYRAFTHEFTHSGEGSVSAAILALTDNPVWIDRIQIRDVSCE